METWKESQLKQLTFAKGIDTAYPILLRFAENLGFNFCAVTVAMPQQVPGEVSGALQVVVPRANVRLKWDGSFGQEGFWQAHCCLFSSSWSGFAPLDPF